MSNTRFLSTKTFGHALGLSCAFRQWRAQSHCRFLHGYALQFTFTFGCAQLDDKNWCMDFGALKPVKAMLELMYDHKTVIAEDDPLLPAFEALDKAKGCDLRITAKVGAEAFAAEAFGLVEKWLRSVEFYPRVWLVKVEVSEHGANSAIVTAE
jgi:6-pyruvoyltetrahydropterin/6-carboxytetrahydropterin synthase